MHNTPIVACPTIDIGCGTGNNAIWLQQHGFNVIGIDSTEIAIERAQEKACEAEADCSFYVLDFLCDDIPEAPFDFAFDRGCFHHFLEYDKLNLFANKVSQVLKDDGLWLSLVGNADETREGSGPPQLSARQIVNTVDLFSRSFRWFQAILTQINRCQLKIGFA